MTKERVTYLKRKLCIVVNECSFEIGRISVTRFCEIKIVAPVRPVIYGAPCNLITQISNFHNLNHHTLNSHWKQSWIGTKNTWISSLFHDLIVHDSLVVEYLKNSDYIFGTCDLFQLYELNLYGIVMHNLICTSLGTQDNKMAAFHHELIFHIFVGLWIFISVGCKPTVHLVLCVFPPKRNKSLILIHFLFQ